jgi:hypothetical protein
MKKLPDFSIDDKFNSLREKMGAEFFQWESKTSREIIDPEDIYNRLISNEGISLDDENLDPHDLIQSDSTFEYKGHKVLIYIRDWPTDKANNGVRERKFHISYCETLSNMEKKGRFFRYIISQKKTGRFLVKILDRNSKKVLEEDPDRKLDVCKMCLSKLNFNGYGLEANSQREKKAIFENFNLEEFFNQYKSTRFKKTPKFNDITGPIDIYPKNWNSTSKSLKEKRNYTCETCGLILKKYKHFLDVHHTGAKYENTEDKLQVLCKGCHAEKPVHSHMKSNPKYKQFLDIKESILS